MDAWVPGLVALLVLLFAGVPIAVAMGIVGAAGLTLILGLQGGMAIVGQTLFDTSLSYSLSVVPLFILMGNFVTRAGLSDELYAACHAWLGARPGGLAMACPRQAAQPANSSSSLANCNRRAPDHCPLNPVAQ